MTPKNKRIVIEEENGEHIEEYFVSFAEAKAMKRILDSMTNHRLKLRINPETVLNEFEKTD